jgi:beta-glucosidase
MRSSSVEARVEALLAKMTLAEKIGQLWQGHQATSANLEKIRRGEVGSLLNVKAEDMLTCQRAAIEESRLGIPLIIGRDVIHGFHTVAPIPLGQAASFNPSTVRQGARMAAREAAAAGIHWTFTPMVDIARDPRWGRIAESLGEDPYLASILGAAMVRGFQGTDDATPRREGVPPGWENLSEPDSIAACVKHYVGYGAAEGGRDYNTTLIPESELRNVYLPPFLACIEAGAATLMSAFNDLNGIPTSGNVRTLRTILKEEWGFEGFVVSDWASIEEMIAHGYCEDHREAAFKAMRAGVDMEMYSPCYPDHLAALIESGEVPLGWLDDATRRILRVKFHLGLFDRDPATAINPQVSLSEDHRRIAYQSAVESCVLLKNDGLLPLGDRETIALIGPLADAPADQLGCWVPDGRAEDTTTVRTALEKRLGKAKVRFAPGLDYSNQTGQDGFSAALAAAREADKLLVVVGESAWLSGEAHSRAYLELPGSQQALIEALAGLGKPLAVVVMAGRPLVMNRWAAQVNAILWAWHPGTEGGAAIVDLIYGDQSPSGRLPVSFPETVGQVPIYYNKRNTGRPPREGQSGLPIGTPLDPCDFTSRYLDADFHPAYTFGYGLTYTTFVFSPVILSSDEMKPGSTLEARVTITNSGKRAGIAVPQLYLRDRSASLTRPVGELKGFQRIEIAPGESGDVVFEINEDHLRFYNEENQAVVEPGEFHLWIGADARCLLDSPVVFQLKF